MLAPFVRVAAAMTAVAAPCVNDWLVDARRCRTPLLLLHARDASLHTASAFHIWCRPLRRCSADGACLFVTDVFF
jgi:hypothetical protein